MRMESGLVHQDLYNSHAGAWEREMIRSCHRLLKFLTWVSDLSFDLSFSADFISKGILSANEREWTPIESNAFTALTCAAGA